MFLGNLSTAQERKARQSSSSSKAPTDELDALLSDLKVDETNDVSLKRKKKGELPILYSKELFQRKIDQDAVTARAAALVAPSSSSSSTTTSKAPPFVPREVVMRFFSDCSLMMEMRHNVAEIVDYSWKSNVPLHIAAMDFQKDVMEYNFQMERAFGCQYISVLNSSDDVELIEAASGFMFACLKCYVACVRFRAKKYYNGQKRTTGGMNKTTVMEFFEACNALMAMPETKATLQREFIDHKKRKSPPNEKVIELQREVLTWLGMDAEYGVNRLNRLGQDYRSDQEVMMKLQHFAMAAQVACREAMMSEEERVAFYQEIPPWLRHCPFAYVMQKNGSEQQRMMQQQQQQQMRSGTMPGGGGVLPGGMTPQAFAAQQQQMMNDPAKRAKMNAFSARLPGFKQSLEPEIAKMNVAAKKAYLTSFADHPALVAVNAAGSDPFLRLERLMDLSDQDLHAVLKMQAIVAHTIQAGGSLESILPPLSTGTTPTGTGSSGASSSSGSGGDGGSNVSGPSGGGMQALHRFLSGGMMAMGAMSGVAITPNTTPNSSSSSNNNSSNNNNSSSSSNSSTTSQQGLDHVHGPNCNHSLSHSHGDNVHADISKSSSSSSSSSSDVATGGLDHDHDHAHEGGHLVEDATTTTTAMKESAMLQGLEFESDDHGGMIDDETTSVIDVVGGVVGGTVVDPAEAERRMQSKTPDVAFGKAASMTR